MGVFLEGIIPDGAYLDLSIALASASFPNAGERHGTVELCKKQR